MKELYKLLLGGFWMLALVILSLFFLDYYQEKYDNVYIVLIWAFAILGGMQISSWSAWAKDYNVRRKKEKEAKKE